MNTYLKILVKLILINILFINPINSKTLPPGTGGEADVPANVLIMLDVSGSMNNRTTVGINYGNQTLAVTPISNSNSILVHANGRIQQINQDSNVVESIHTSRQRLEGNCQTRNLEKKVVYYDNKIYYYTNNRRALYEYDVSNNRCRQIERPNAIISHMFLDGDNLVLMNHRSRNYYVKDLTSVTTRSTTCSVQRNSTLERILGLGMWWTHPHFTFNADSDGNLVAIGSLDRRSQTQLYKFSSTGTCFNSNPNETFTINNVNSIHTPSSIVGHPTNSNQFFVTDSIRHNLTKISLSGTSITIDRTVGRWGRINASYNPTSDRSDIRFQEPYHISLESSNSRIYVADARNRSIQSFDYDLNFQKITGITETMTRMQGAQRAIQSIVTDSSLISSVNFGYGIWSDYLVYGWSRFFRVNGINSITRNEAQGRHEMTWLRRWFNRAYYALYGGSFGLDQRRVPGFERWDNGSDNGFPCTSVNCIYVKADRDGASKTNSEIMRATPSSWTNANFFAKQAKDYFDHSSESPVDKNSDCQGNYLIVIGDGEFTSGERTAFRTIRELANRTESPVKTIPIAYGTGISATGIAAFHDLAEAGGTGDAIIAASPQALKARLTEIIRNIQADKLAFTAPAITAKVGEGGFLYQAQFQYRQKKEWQGSLSATHISDSGELDENHASNWEAAKSMPLPNSRKIWTVLPTIDYKGNWNNFTEDNSLLINEQFEILGAEVGDYHNDSPTSSANIGTARCSNTGDSRASIQNGNSDDIKGLISFIRGEDYFDYDSDCLLNEPRIDDNGQRAYLGDIYHSELVFVGPPNANTNYIKKNEEAYYRSTHNYNAFKNANKNRLKTIYVGANDGMIHAFNADTGQELWAFVPPFITGKLPFIVNPSLNDNNAKVSKGGSSAIYGVDGSPVVHDMRIAHPYYGGVNWYTIMMVPFGRGGAGFTVLDITKPNEPLHLYSIYNDSIANRILRMNHLGIVSEFQYIDETYSWLDFEEVDTVIENYVNDNSVSSTCDDTLTTACYTGRNFTLPLSGLMKEDVQISINGSFTRAFEVSQNSGNTVISFNSAKTYDGNTSGTSGNPANSTLLLSVDPDAIARLSTNLPEDYDYTKLGETWSSPRIFRLPISSTKEKYVAVMGAGYGAASRTVGSGVFVIDFNDFVDRPGRIEKMISIEDQRSFSDDIINSVLANPVVITADQTQGINYKGALVYINDLEGKITKINLTDMRETKAGLRTELYDSTVIFETNSTSRNGRYMFHSMDTAIGTTSKNLWLYAGTGDYERVTYKSNDVDNLLLGFRDKDFPYYEEVNQNFSSFSLMPCQDTSTDSTGIKCPLDTDDKVFMRGIGRIKKDVGWYIKLENSQKVVAEPTITRGVAYFPIYEPTTSLNQCDAGKAFVCAVDDECGTNFSRRLGTNDAENRNQKCFYVGDGVLSKLVVFGNKLFANIAGQSTQDKTDLVQLEGIQEDVGIIRSSWKEGNF